MLDRLEMDVVRMPLQIIVVADQVLPIPALPDPALTPTDTLRAAALALAEGDVRSRF